jgi:NitT/TauT family transport system ATP-binding protein
VPADDVIIETRALEKFYTNPDGKRIEVVAPLDLSVRAGQILALLGPSGSGKSTLLRMITGLSRPSAGEVLWNGCPLQDCEPNVAIVFQSFALFPWLTVLENVEVALQARGVAAAERRERAMKTLDTVGLDGFESAYPKELSGGMKQRVGFARALVVEPEVLFMDEPFSALDVLTAETMRGELLELWRGKKMHTRAIFIVTHNIEEAVFLADRAIVLGKNPARVREDFEIELFEGRDRHTPRFQQIVDHIYHVLTEPDTAHAPLEAAAAPTASTGDKFQMLPHSRPGGIAGLCELLSDRGGRDDVYHLADELGQEADDLLPIIGGCEMLGFAKVVHGDVELTPAGQQFAEADIQQRKVIFRQAALEHVNLLRQIEQALRSKKNHALPQDFFADVLDEHFSADEVQRQLETAIHWGRYSEIFEYDATEARFVLTEP